MYSSGLPVTSSEFVKYLKSGSGSYKVVSGWASQWFPASFTATVKIEGQEQAVIFPSTEHWMMTQKALLFSDVSIAREVLSLTGTSKSEMAYVKSLGRKVKNFDEDVWKGERKRIVLEGNLLKFRQNDELRKKLMETGDKMIVESSPRDRIWGIGYGEKNAISNAGKWGLNLLGKALVETRRILREEETKSPSHCDW